MRILLMMDPLIAVPPRHYGGIERVVADLANGLVARGHEVVLWAAPGSDTRATLAPFGKPGEWTRFGNVRNTAVLTARLWRQARRFDVVHNFGRLAYLAGILRSNLPKIQTYMRTVNPRNMWLAARLGARRLSYTAVSNAIRETGAAGGGEWSVIYNCAPVDQHPFRGDVDAGAAPLVWLGRLERCKGAHTAIAVAHRLKRQLIVAGTLGPSAADREYFRSELEPHFGNGLIRYVGPVDNAQKSALLGSAGALLLPIEWYEPFPVVLPEALLCGTPVVAFRRGGVPEGIDHGRTGFVCDTIDEMCGLVGRLGELDRRTCREEAIRRFSDEAIVAEYERLYEKMCRGE